jgi:hypothetical protein
MCETTIFNKERPMTEQEQREFDEIRKVEATALNATAAQTREEVEKRFGQVWDTQELQKEFVVEGFVAPYVVVTRKSDGKRGSLRFQHLPRWYFDWQEE